INFDRSGKQYFADLYALACLRTATTTDGGATVSQEIYPAGCSGIPGADRQWLAVYDPAPGTPNQSAYTGPKPLIYLEYNNVVSGAQWNKSNSAVDLVPGGPGLTYMAATNGTTSPCVANGSFYAPFGADGYPAIDQVTGKVLQASGSQNSDGTFSLLLNIGTPDASGDLTFLDFPSVANPCGDSVNVFPWIKAGGAGRADAVWYGSNLSADPSSQSGQAWNVYMSQVVYATDSTGAVSGGAPSVTLVKVSPHPMHYNDICLAGSGCIASQGNRNLADFFAVTIDHTGAAEIVYDDTSNGLAQAGFTPTGNQTVDHAGAGVITVARQSSGPGLFGTNVSGPSNAPTTGI